MKTLFRAAVMLVVLVGLPAAWVYYGPLPESAQRVVDRLVVVAREALQRWPSRSDQPNSAGYESAGELGEPTRAPAIARDSPPTSEPTGVLATLLGRLEQLGAIAYDLEHWGTRGELYRFHCEMPLGAGNAFTQQFEAISSDPQSSVEQVVNEVASWRLARAGTALR